MDVFIYAKQETVRCKWSLDWKGFRIKQVDCLTLEDGTNWLSQNIGN
jgi:hypothetical protein